jgi:hypothetical protein
MLSEAWRLRQALERAGVKPRRKHKRVKEPGRTFPCLRVRLNEAGQVAAIQDVAQDDWPSWTVMEGNMDSFPVVRVQDPLLELPREHELWQKLGYDEHRKRSKPPSLSERTSSLSQALAAAVVSLYSKKTQDLWKRLRDRKARELAGCSRERESELKLVSALAERFERAAHDPESLLKGIAESAVALLGEGKLANVDAVEQLLVGKGPPDEAGKRPDMKVQLAFDLGDPDKFKYGVYSPPVKQSLIEVLPEELEARPKRRGTSQHGEKGTDAFTGEAADIEMETFPKASLPVFSFGRRGATVGRKEFPIASMAKEAGCNQRYGLREARVFPVAKTRARKLKEALEFITADEREEKTWQQVASGRFDRQRRRTVEKPDLLIAYVEEEPELDAKTAGYFGRGQRVQDAKFDVDSAAVCSALKGVVKERPSSRLNLFLIREASKGQAHVVLAESPTVAEVLGAAERWQRAVNENLPPVTLPLPPQEKGQKAVEGRPHAPYPDQIVRLLSFQWVRDGSSGPVKGTKGKRQKPNHEVNGPGLGDVLAVMLRTDGKWEPAARRMLELILRRVGPLLLGAVGALRSGESKRWENYPPSSRETALRAVAVLGILLDALGRQKEVYMNGVPFQLGRLLSLADTLHREYCVHVRSGGIPPQLIGNALMPAAANNPQDAVDRLRERLSIYKAWAVKSEGEEYRLAKWALGQMGKVCETLSQSPIPANADQAFRVELFLGYMASPPKE